METLLQDIADYCHGEGRRIQSKQTSMDDVLGEAERQLSDQLRKTEAVITHDALPAVEGDFFALATVLRHLIHNACKFRSAAAPCIHVGVSKSGPEWLFSVRDNGLGFKPAYAEAVFQPFKRFHGREYPGSGLGLAVAERIVEQHGGRMWAESAPGEGSTFWFSLPAAR
jgi:light-regulated signal transduction histidine kinase (bacteriophytochrome)